MIFLKIKTGKIIISTCIRVLMGEGKENTGMNTMIISKVEAKRQKKNERHNK